MNEISTSNKPRSNGAKTGQRRFCYVCWNKNARSNFDKFFLMMNEFLVIIHLQY